jgi:hypothetical protein
LGIGSLGVLDSSRRFHACEAAHPILGRKPGFLWRFDRSQTGRSKREISAQFGYPARSGPGSILSSGPHYLVLSLKCCFRTTTMSNLTQTKTPYALAGLPQKDALTQKFVGQPLEALRTPAMVIDRSIFQKNCLRMLQNATEWGASLRSHLKTHKVPLFACLKIRYIC